jgi:hypothetical protein
VPFGPPLMSNVRPRTKQRMVTSPSTSHWAAVQMPILKTVELSTSGCELDRGHWPSWAARGTQFNRILAYCPQPGATPRAASSSSRILAALLTERLDPKDYPQFYNYNLYLIAETTDGRLFQSPPVVPSNPTHHSSSPSTWFEGLGSPL